LNKSKTYDSEEIKKCLLENLKFPDDTQLQQRGIADKIEQRCNDILKEYFDSVRPAKSRRSIEDVTVNGCFIDHKTTDVARDFKMPNLISIDRLIKLDTPLLYNFVKYDSDKKIIVDIDVMNVYQLNWEHLSIQNLGVGQLQIKNMVSFLSSPKTNLTRTEWIKKLQQESVKFYDKLIVKTTQRKQKWMNLTV
jgi:hypothetical protein